MSTVMASFAGEFGKSFLSISWKDEGLTDGINGGPAKIQKQLDMLMAYYAPEVENWMKSNAVWTDQTGAARNGLAARPYSTGDGKGIILYHQVPYGIWLEVRFSGKYAIISPALQEWGPRVMAGCRGMLEKM